MPGIVNMRGVLDKDGPGLSQQKGFMDRFKNEKAVALASAATSARSSKAVAASFRRQRPVTPVLKESPAAQELYAVCDTVLAAIVRLKETQVPKTTLDLFDFLPSIWGMSGSYDSVSQEKDACKEAEAPHSPTSTLLSLCSFHCHQSSSEP